MEQMKRLPFAHRASTMIKFCLEPIIESEVSQKEKDKYDILMHIYGI